MADPASYRPKPGTIPTDPGVYRFSDAHGQVIYVGKAKNLRQRLNSYFADPAGLHFRTQTMVRTAAKVEWTVVRNELESLQLEYTWIQQYDPRFNVKYRDDKSYPWLCVTWSEEFPRVFVGRGAKKKGWRYYGPFGQAWAIRETLDAVLQVFPMRSCSTGVFNNAKASGRPCLLGHIGKCAAPCVARVGAEEHREIAADLCSFFAGHTGALTRKLESRMRAAAENMEYEQAAVHRDSLEALKRVAESNAVVLADATDADVINVAEDPLELAIQIFHVRAGRIRGERAWIADRADDATMGELIEQFLLQLYGGGDDISGFGVPRQILVPELPDSAPVLEELLSESRGRRVDIRVPRRGDKVALLDTVGRNAAQALAQHKTRRASDLTTRNNALEELRLALGLETAPLRIECYDISHLQGTEVVASMVVFEDGLPRKSEYRRFIIRTVEGSNDVGAMREVLTRRFRRLLDDRAAMAADHEHDADAPGTDADDRAGARIDPTTGQPRKFSYAPALLVVDGGLPQVQVAAEVLDELGLSGEIGLCGLAKRLEEVWIPDDDHPLILPRTSEGLYLLQRVRDEAHRFAITHHRGRRSQAMVESMLDEVPGLGEVRRKTLLKHFGSMKKLRAASVDDIAAVPGFGPKLAEAIVAALGVQEPGVAINTATGEVVSQ